MLRSLHPLWNASAQNEGGVCQFSPIGAKNRLITATSLEQSPKEDRIDHAHPLFTYPEHLLKIGPVHSENQGTVKNKENNIGTSYSPSACQRQAGRAK